MSSLDRSAIQLGICHTDTNNAQGSSQWYPTASWNSYLADGDVFLILILSRSVSIQLQCGEKYCTVSGIREIILLDQKSCQVTSDERSLWDVACIGTAAIPDYRVGWIGGVP